MVGANPDDAELRAAGLALKYLKTGAEAEFPVLCNGRKGHHILSPEETVRTRAGEAAAVKKILGLTGYRIRDIEDCELEVTLANRRRLIRDIRAFAPDIVIGHRTNDYHADHRAAAQLLQDASYMLIVPHDCPDVPAVRQMPVINKQEYSAHCGDVLLAAEGARHGGQRQTRPASRSVWNMCCFIALNRRASCCRPPICPS